MKKISKKELSNLLIKIIEKNPSIYGEYEYDGIRILVKKPKLILGRERSKRLYDSRRQKGLCVHCGKKVKTTNPATGSFYRLCNYHRQLELERKKQNRQKKIKLRSK